MKCSATHVHTYVRLYVCMYAVLAVRSEVRGKQCNDTHVRTHVHNMFVHM